jgi:formylmethanofuran dehydrogenase subunit E
MERLHIELGWRCLRVIASIPHHFPDTGVRDWQAAEWDLTELCARSQDEELVAVVETDRCGVDAIQFLIGRTFGKDNLIHMEYGKNAFADGIPHQAFAGTDLVHTLL